VNALKTQQVNLESAIRDQPKFLPNMGLVEGDNNNTYIISSLRDLALRFDNLKIEVQ